MRGSRCVGSLVALALSAATASAAEHGIHTPGVQAPAVLERIGSVEGLTAFALSSGGDQAVAAFPADRPGRSLLRLYSLTDSEPRSMPLNGNVRDLLYDRAPGVLYGLLHRPTKRGEGETTLVVIDLARLKIRRSMRVPPSSSGLDHWITRGALLLAARDEIRTIVAPAMRSGPLYRIPGENLSVASIGGGSLVLVGQTESLLLVDLEDPPEEYQMPVRDRIDTNLAVRSLATSADGSGGLAHLDDGSLWSIGFLPLQLRAQGTALAVATPPASVPATGAIRALERATRLPEPEPEPTRLPTRQPSRVSRTAPPP